MLFPDQIAAYIISALQITSTETQAIIVLIILAVYFATILSVVACLAVYALKNKFKNNVAILKNGL